MYRHVHCNYDHHCHPFSSRPSQMDWTSLPHCSLARAKDVWRSVPAEVMLFSQSLLMLGARHLIFLWTGSAHGRSSVSPLQTRSSLKVRAVHSPFISASSPVTSIAGSQVRQGPRCPVTVSHPWSGPCGSGGSQALPFRQPPI